jgi:Ser/Thr protein kinase RdoA (MazF antagonist)
MQVSESLLAQGASLFGTQPSALQSLGGIDGAVYAYQRDGAGFILKFVPTPPDRVPLARAKWDFADYLARNGVSVARPVPSSDGQLIEILEKDGTSYVVFASEQAPGQHADWRQGKEANDRVFEAWGRVLGRMHALTKSYAGGDAFGGWEQEHASFADWCQEEDVRAKWMALGDYLQTLPQCPDCYGLLHNDLHPNNFFVHVVDDQPQITVIDFDVCNRHWFATDIATSMYPLAVRWVRSPDKRVSHRAFVQNGYDRFMAGYTSENEIDSAWRERMPHFLKYRQILLYIVFSDEWKDPNQWQKQALREWRQLILNDVPVIDLAF